MRMLTLGIPQNFCFCKGGEQEEKMNPFLAKIPESMTLLLMEVDLKQDGPQDGPHRDSDGVFSTEFSQPGNTSWFAGEGSLLTVNYVLMGEE